MAMAMTTTHTYTQMTKKFGDEFNSESEHAIRTLFTEIEAKMLEYGEIDMVRHRKKYYRPMNQPPGEDDSSDSFGSPSTGSAEDIHTFAKDYVKLASQFWNTYVDRLPHKKKLVTNHKYNYFFYLSAWF